MDNINFLEHIYIRTEADDKYMILLKVDPTFLEQELDITLNDYKLKITREDKQIWETFSN